MALFFSACADPGLQQFSLDTPAQTLSVIEAPPVIDGRQRFRDIFCQLLSEDPANGNKERSCDDYLWRLSDEPDSGKEGRPIPGHNTQFKILILPGLFGECMANTVLPFEIAMDRLRASGYTIDHLIVSGRSGSDHNAEQIAETLSGVNLSKEEKLILIGHSKGAVDILHFLVNYPEQSKHVAAVISVAGAINGSPWADKLAGTYKTLGAKVKNSACEPGDGGALESLKRTTRLSWLAEHSLPRTVKFFSIAGFTDREGINRHLAVGYDQLKRIDPRNDGLLLFSDQIMPGATLLGYAHADHWEIVYPLEDKIPWAAKSDSNRPFPRGVLFESVILYVAETFNEEDSRNGSD